MAIAILKLLLTPLLIGGASLGARRWGPTAGGWIVSLPLTSGPVAFFLALAQGPAFGAAAARASLAGCIAIALYCTAWSRAATLRGWPGALAAGAAGWLAGALAIQPAMGWPIPVLFGLVVATTAGALRIVPAAEPLLPAPSTDRRDVGVRMVTATAIVVFVTGAAPILGPGPSGVLAMLPIIGSILAIFAQRAGGPTHGIGTQRGILSGLVGTAAFLAVVAGALEAWGVPLTFMAAIATVVTVQAAILGALRRIRGTAAATAGAESTASADARSIAAAIREG